LGVDYSSGHFVMFLWHEMTHNENINEGLEDIQVTTIRKLYTELQSLFLEKAKKIATLNYKI
jgi:hypothetical protein